MPEPYYLSPYCVFYSQPDGARVTVVHGLYGSRFEISSGLFCLLTRFLVGGRLGTFAGGLSADERKAIEELADERVLIDHEEFEKLCSEPIFKNRLQPVELAFLRGFNEGRVRPEAVDGKSAPPAEKTVKGLRTIDLQTHRTGAIDGLAAYLRRRCSIRSYSDEPLSRRRFEEFLEMTARAYGLFTTPQYGQMSLRNYPSGGARYPLEVYPVVCNVEGIEKGIYHYQPFRHRLTLLTRNSSYCQILLGSVVEKLGGPEERRGEPAVLLAITAVFARTCWKYDAIPLHVILQEVGALQQTMYLAATALDLAPCAIGVFPELAVDEMLGLDNRDEAQVGMFALGAPISTGAPTFVVEEFRLLPQSPFSSEPNATSVQLVFNGGMTETIAVEGFEIEGSDDGGMVCSVMRRRFRARFGRHAQDQLLAVLRAGQSPLSSKFSHLLE